MFMQRTTPRDTLGNGLLASIHPLQQVSDAGSDFRRRPCTRHRPPGATVTKASEAALIVTVSQAVGRQAGGVRFDYDCMI